MTAKLARTLTLLVLSLFQLLPVVGDELDEATRQRMQQRVEYLNQEMIQLLQKLEQRSHEQHSSAWGALLFAALQQWQFWAVAGLLVLLFGLYCWLRKRNHDQEEEEECSELLQMYRFMDEHSSCPMPRKQFGICILMEQLVNDLICVCQNLSSNSFMPRLQPAVFLGCSVEGEIFSGDFVYRLLVPLKPPPGHSFHIERGGKGDRLVRDTCLRVQLECTCTRQRRLGDVLCFLHNSEEKLMIRQEASLLQTLCSGSYLDIQKTAFWLQVLMTASSATLLEGSKCEITFLPSKHFCKFKLTNSVKTFLYVELILAVQEDNDFVIMA